jgi:hypothetical protein
MPAFLERGSGGNEFLPVLRNRHAGLLEGRVRQPQPLPGMDVDRHAVDLAVERAAIQQRARLDDLAPFAFFRRDIGQVAHQAGFCTSSSAWRPWLNCVAAMGSPPVMRLIMIGRAVPPEPAMAPSIHLLPVASKAFAKLGDGRGLAARRPPMRDFEFCGLHRASNVESRRRSEGGGKEPITHHISSLKL